MADAPHSSHLVHRATAHAQAAAGRAQAAAGRAHAAAKRAAIKTLASYDADVAHVAPAPPQWWHNLWCFVIDFFLAVWIVRAPLALLLFGWTVLCNTIQAQDLLLGLADSAWQHKILWFQVPGKFLLSLIVFWAFPTGYTASILLKSDHRFMAPPNGPACPPDWPERQRKSPRAYFRQMLTVLIPLLLGVAVIGGVLIALDRALDEVPTDQLNDVMVSLAPVRASISAAMFAFPVLILCLWLIGKLGVVKAFDRYVLGFVLEPVRKIMPPSFALWRDACNRSPIQSNLGLLFLAAIFGVFVIWPIKNPFVFVETFPLAAAIPIMIGGWVPLLSFLSGLGRRLHVPILALGLLLITLLPLAFSPGYQMRVVPATPASDEANAHPLRLDEAVALWKSLNKCDGKEGHVTACPRPVIVAAAGGATRAGFFTASVIGQLLDAGQVIDTRADPKQPQPASVPTPGEMANRLFAFSTVSGSSVAATMAVAAMDVAARERGWREPCEPQGNAAVRWFWNGNQKGRNWRWCLEALMSGDFLTPVFTGLMFRDSIRVMHWLSSFFGYGPWPDRGTLLEESWEAHFQGMIGGKDPGLRRPFLDLKPSTTRWLPLLVLNSTSVSTGQRIVTTVLDETYEPADVCPNHRLPRKPCTLFSNSYRFHNLLNPPGGTNGPEDVTLSTAAHNSARFPFVSPPAEIPDGRGGVADRVVDGGYFENFGAQTAAELAEAIIAVDDKLDPFVLVLSNNPELPRDCKPTEPAAKSQQGGEETRCSERDRQPRAAKTSVLTDLSDTFAAFFHTRNARGELAKDDLRAILDRNLLGKCNVAFLRVWGDPMVEFGAAGTHTSTVPGAGKDDANAARETRQARAVSMSWWLSRTMQEFLHRNADFAGVIETAPTEPASVAPRAAKAEAVSFAPADAGPANAAAIISAADTRLPEGTGQGKSRTSSVKEKRDAVYGVLAALGDKAAWRRPPPECIAIGHTPSSDPHRLIGGVANEPGRL